MSMKRKVFAVAAGAVAVITTTVVAATTASAGSAPSSLPASQFTLTADYDQYDALNAALTSTLGTASVDTVMKNANHERTSISSPGVAGYKTGFGWDSTDNSGCHNYPQGITSSRDAIGDTGHGMRVFNMTDILKTSTGGTSDQIGRQSSGVYYAHNYAYVLPQIGTITANTTATNPLNWSSISLDRVSGSIVMVEYTCQSGCTSFPNRAPRAVRFPFTPGTHTFAAKTTATEALQLPWYKLNGVASHNNR